MTGVRTSTKAVVDVGRRALAWWGGELASLVPTRLRERRSMGRGAVLVMMDGHQAVFRRPGGPDGKAGELGRVLLGGDPAAVRTAAQAVLRRLPTAAETAVLQLSRDQVLRRPVALPVAAGADLREALGYELDRITPFVADDAYFDCRVLGKDPSGRHLRIDFAAAERRRVDAARTVVEGWGLSIRRIGLAGGAGEPETLFDLSGAEPPTGSVGSWRLTAALSVLALGLGVAAVHLPLAAKRAEADALAADVKLARVRAADAEALRADIERLAAAGSFVTARKSAAPAMVEIILEVTRVVPDGAWLSQLRIDGTEVQLSGHAQAASALLERVEASGLLRAAHFRSPVTREPRAEVERFDIVAQIESKEAL